MYDLDAGPVINVITAFLNPDPIWGAMTTLAGIGTVFLWLFPLFAAIRLLRESASVGLKSCMADVFGDMVRSMQYYLMYTFGGLVLFGAIFVVAKLFENMGSARFIEISLADFRGEMLSTEKQNSDWIEAVLQGAADLGNTMLVPLFYLFYQLTSLFYIFIKHMMFFIFALLMAITYLWGFVAIACESLPDKAKMMDGFWDSFKALAIWAIIQPVAMGLIWVLQQPAQATLLSKYAGGYGPLALNVWSAYTGILLIVTSLVLIILPFAASKLAANKGMTDAFAGGAAGLAAVVGNQMASYFGDQASKSAGGPLSGMMPSDEGSRRRDGIFQSMSDAASGVANADLISKAGGAGNSIANSMGNLVSGGGDESGGLAGGNADTGNNVGSGSENTVNTGSGSENVSSVSSGMGNAASENAAGSQGETNNTESTQSTETANQSTSEQSSSLSSTASDTSSSMGNATENTSQQQQEKPDTEGDNNARDASEQQSQSTSWSDTQAPTDNASSMGDLTDEELDSYDDMPENIGGPDELLDSPDFAPGNDRSSMGDLADDPQDKNSQDNEPEK